MSDHSPIHIEDEVPEDSYRIELPQFEGPFDLLLFFIERDELDIQDIQISTITNDFLEYIRQMSLINIEMASEFILVAGTLCKIKAKLLLPRPELNEEGDEIDPREDLIRRLTEYKRYKEVLGQLADMETAAAERSIRGYTKTEEREILRQTDYPEEDLVGINLFSLMRAFRRVMEKNLAELRKPAHVIRRYNYTVEEVKIRLMDKVDAGGKVDFLSLITEENERIYAVFCFLSILELLQVQMLSITVGEGFNNFWLERKVVE